MIKYYLGLFILFLMLIRLIIKMIILGLALICNLAFFLSTLFILNIVLELNNINYFIIFIYYILFCLLLICLAFITPINRIRVLVAKKDKTDQNIIYLINKNNFTNLKLKIFFITNSDKKFAIIAHNNSFLIINKDYCDLDYLGLDVCIKEQMINLLYKLENKKYAFIFIVTPIKICYLVFKFLLKKLKFVLKSISKLSLINKVNPSWSIISILISLFLIIILSLLSPIIIASYLFNYLTILLENFILSKYNNLTKKYCKVLYQ